MFIICAETFSRLISCGIESNIIHDINICRGAPTLSQLFFADDSNTYERASGQKVNYDKTEISFSKGVSYQLRKDIVEILGVKEVDGHVKYLGLPTIIGRFKKAIFSCLRDRIWKKKSKDGKKNSFRKLAMK